MKRTLLAALVTAGLALTACSPTPDPAPTPTQTVAPVVVTVDPLAVAEQPNNPALYPDQGGAPTAPINEPNGATPEIPAIVAEQSTIALQGFGGTLTFARMGRPGARLTPAEAVAVAIREAEHPSGINWQNKCEGFAGSFVYGWASSGWYSAREAYLNLPNKHKLVNWNDPPAGSLLYWPNLPYGHVSLALGGGKTASTDILTIGRVGIVPIKLIADKWFGGAKPVWVEPVTFPRGSGSNGIKAPIVKTPPKPPAPAGKPAVSLSKLRRVAYHGGTYCKAQLVRRALGGTGSNCRYSQRLRSRYKSFQKANHLHNHNGIPTRHSLTLLAAKSGKFTVIR